MPLTEGEEFAGYLIERLLGTGGMGEVYLARHPRLPRHDALKVLAPTSTADTEFRARFTREAEMAATLRHPHIVGVLDRGEFDGRLWISMDYVDGTDAGRLQHETYPRGLPESDVVEIVAAVADALDFAHERRLLHRDVKPENILVTASDGRRRRVLLTDFGIARRIDDVSNLTDDNVAIGTVSYMSPEQLRGQPLDGRADQYALAATAFHLLTGAPPFDDSNRAVVIGHHLGTPPPRMSARRPELAHLDGVFAKALAKNPDQRYPTCLDFAEALSGRRRAAGDTQPHSAPAAGPHDRPATQRLEHLVLRGTAYGVQHSADGAWRPVSFRLIPFDRLDHLPTPVPVAISDQLESARLDDGATVDVQGVWDGETLDADEITVYPAPAPPAPRSSQATATFDVAPGTSPKPRSRRPVVLAALAGVILVAVGAVAWFTDGFGVWARPGPIITPARATVFAPGGAPDNPDEARLVIDGNPDTSWSTVTYTDPVPFPNFVEGEGLMLHLSEPTAVSAVTIDLSSTGTEVQIRSSPSEDPGALSDTTVLAPTTKLQPGHNRIEIGDRTPTSNVLVWISTLGTTDGKSRTAISEITVQAAAS
ncbi:serine/threonine protein kinase [Mycolicibacterium sp. 018/SC-01/001]|uniref:serine/threonine-protein kinase n=1 Tax=Mycolicibacterium sp. 018/SC-01/001 TaxID=2592069 RepID=UPI00117C5FAE|nr:serine/threonine-protein kinase [Mycolicibacterium sp. 018/SC-01/001]TRW77572.1 serine/threonine protein kinase [Mycolicibacterium sp. 018/SC-01/001]